MKVRETKKDKVINKGQQREKRKRIRNKVGKKERKRK
jgi:hypothetical protein